MREHNIDSPTISILKQTTTPQNKNVIPRTSLNSYSHKQTRTTTTFSLKQKVTQTA